jgi:subtilisin family serine protease
MDPLSLVALTPLMDRSRGRPEVVIGLIDGPVALDHPGLARDRVRELGGRGASSRRDSHASLHGVFVAGILTAERGAPAPAICPGCTLLVRPVFDGTASLDDMPSTTATELAAAILDCVGAGARVLNISAALAPPFLKNEQALEKALTHAARRGVIVVAAAGNQRTLAGTTITRHQWVVPVVSYNLQGRPSELSNLGHSIGRRGLGAPGDAITSLGEDSKGVTAGGTSAAAPFVTGAMALLWSEFPSATAGDVKAAVMHAHRRRPTVVPPLLDAWGAYQGLRGHR